MPIFNRNDTPQPPADYVRLWEAYVKLRDECSLQASIDRRSDKFAKLMEEKKKAFLLVHAAEREHAKQGLILEAGKVIGTARRKRSLQETYVDGFSDDKPVRIGGQETTLREYHTNRLLKSGK